MTLEINSYNLDDGFGNDMNTGDVNYRSPQKHGGGGGGDGSADPWALPDWWLEKELGHDPNDMSTGGGDFDETAGSVDIGGNTGPYSQGDTWENVDATDKDNEIADYLWDQTGPFTQGIFDGSYQEGMPGYNDYMQNTGMGSLQDYMGANQPGLNSYFDTFMNNNPAWEANAKYGENMLLERMGGGGGSASGGFSGQQAAGLGRYWSDQTADRWSQAQPAAFAQWGQDSGAVMSDYSNMYQQNTMDFSNQLSAYNRPYDYAQNAWGGTPVSGVWDGRANQNMNAGGNQGPGTWETLGGIGGMALGSSWGPMGAIMGGGLGSTLGGWFD